MLAAAFLLVAALLPADANAQSPPQKRAAPTGKAKAVRPAAAASGWVANPAVDGRDAYLILDATSGRELASDQPDELRHPASLTKLMTIYLTFSALDSGRLSLGDGLPVSINALNAPPTKMGLPPGGTVSVRDATMALVTRSANDAAVVLAEALGGDEASFAQLMTSKARQLGMSQTVFRNASGLPNREQVTTARDMARLAYALMRDFPHYYPVFSVQSYPYRGRTLENHNRMLGSYEGADGLKTGYTNASGFNLVMSAMRDNRRLIGVVMGGDSAGQRDRLMADADGPAASPRRPAMRLSAWTNIRKPPSARYTSANFDPGLVIPESTPRLATASAAAAGRLHGRRAAAACAAPPASQRVAGPAVPPPAEGSVAPRRPADRQLGDPGRLVQRFAGRPARARARVVDAARHALGHARPSTKCRWPTRPSTARGSPTSPRTQAVDGCKRLEKKKIYCSAIQVTAWNTPSAR